MFYEFHSLRIRRGKNKLRFIDIKSYNEVEKWNKNPESQISNVTLFRGFSPSSRIRIIDCVTFCLDSSISSKTFERKYQEENN